MTRKLLYALIIFQCLINVAVAQTAAIDNGVLWLKTSQNPDFSWGDPAAFESTRVVDTTEVVNTLGLLNIKDTTYTNALNWLSSVAPDNNHTIARRLIAFSSSGGFSADDLNVIVSSQNANGGWGALAGVQSIVVDTVFNLLALHSVNHPDQTLINAALAYLLTTQNADGGFGFYAGDISNLYMTALVSATLQQFTQTISIASALNRATSFLVAHQNADGGFSASPSITLPTPLKLRGESTPLKLRG